MNKHQRRISTLLGLLVVSILATGLVAFPAPVQAAEKPQAYDLFLCIDISGSQTANFMAHQAAARALSYVLPEGSRIGGMFFANFNYEAKTSANGYATVLQKEIKKPQNAFPLVFQMKGTPEGKLDFRKHFSVTETKLENAKASTKFEQEWYSNMGTALNTARDNLKGESANKKVVLMLSDAEVWIKGSSNETNMCTEYAQKFLKDNKDISVYLLRYKTGSEYKDNITASGSSDSWTDVINADVGDAAVFLKALDKIAGRNGGFVQEADNGEIIKTFSPIQNKSLVAVLKSKENNKIKATLSDGKVVEPVEVQKSEGRNEYYSIFHISNLTDKLTITGLERGDTLSGYWQGDLPQVIEKKMTLSTFPAWLKARLFKDAPIKVELDPYLSSSIANLTVNGATETISAEGTDVVFDETGKYTIEFINLFDNPVPEERTYDLPTFGDRLLAWAATIGVVAIVLVALAFLLRGFHKRIKRANDEMEKRKAEAEEARKAAALEAARLIAEEKAAREQAAEEARQQEAQRIRDRDSEQEKAERVYGIEIVYNGEVFKLHSPWKTVSERKPAVLHLHHINKGLMCSETPNPDNPIFAHLPDIRFFLGESPNVSMEVPFTMEIDRNMRHFSGDLREQQELHLGVLNEIQQGNERLSVRLIEENGGRNHG
ncbi:MAG: VWA domain-containing protein [Oscillospiraceae bacterium]|nr:VWA domain-containing protein [Oscillospiraceae bacterium]